MLRFLEVDDRLALQSAETPPLKGVRSLPLLQLGLVLSIARREAAARGPVLEALMERVPRPTRGTAFGALWHGAVYGEPPAIDQAFLLELRHRFKPEVVALSEHLGRDLVSLWGYDRIG